jgi:hypothetical protein
LTSHFATRPLQRKDDIAKALKMVGIDDLWATIEPNAPKRDAMMDELEHLVQRRNHIAHEGDRECSRRSGKRLRPIDKAYAHNSVAFVKGIIDRIEKAFPG